MGITLTDALAASSQTCAHHELRATGKDDRQYRLTSNTVFCYDGEIITSWPNVRERAEAWSKWKVLDYDSRRTSGGQGHARHSDYAWGKFEGKYVDSTVTSTVHINKFQKADGTGHTQSWITGY